MKQHIIILLILFIIISLYNQCNKKNLNKLQNKATNNIIEEFSDYQEALANESGQWGYKITGITEGKYGGRSKKEVLNNIDSHDENHYITDTEKDTYSSNGYVNSNINGEIIGSSDCDIGNAKYPTNCETDCYNGLLSYIYKQIKFQIYGGSSCQEIDTIHSNIGYKYILKQEDVCSSFIEEYNLTTISLYTDDYDSFEITDISETNWCGFFYSYQIFNILDLTDIKKGNIITKEQYNILNNNQKDSPQYLDMNNYLKYKKNEQYYILEITFESNISGNFDMKNTFYIRKDFDGNYRDYDYPTLFTYTYRYNIYIGYTIYYKLKKSLDQINLLEDDIEIKFYLNDYDPIISWIPSKSRYQLSYWGKSAYDNKAREANNEIIPALKEKLNDILDGLVDKNIYNVKNTNIKSESENMIHFEMVYSKSEPKHLIMSKVRNRSTNISFDIDKHDLSNFKINIEYNDYLDYNDIRSRNNFTYTSNSYKKINLNNFQVHELLNKI